MGLGEKYRRNAAECLEMAGVVKDPESRASLTVMARAWVRLAEQAEKNELALQNPPLRTGLEDN
jgi:hypothetical protein